ncbi:hypothetical protein [Sphingobacterium sp. CZ-2]|uniref:hypothetical protein n=1 Tax=Sphingobacterium sp. CZ-2 TaxID=2557994 RepID=UPI00142F464B|nr:hypothetical protein [Sphingobacterium sp. CZ-2]
MNSKLSRGSQRILGGTLLAAAAITASAYSNSPTMDYGYDYSTNQWIPVDGLHTCKPDPSKVCKFRFEAPPTETETPEQNSGTPLSDRGSYELP